MVAVFNKELLSLGPFCLIKQILESGNSDRPIRDDGEEAAKTSPESEWVISIKEKLEQASQYNAAGPWAKFSIYKVPQHLRKGDDDKAYVPQMVSLGPYHHGKKRLRQMDRHKWRSLDRMLSRNNQDIKIYIDSMKELEENARASYEGHFSTLSSNKFVEMMVLDGCFVLELFLGYAMGFEKLGYLQNDPVFALRESMHHIQIDMLMLENQLPLFILDRLMGLQLGKDEKGLVSGLALSFFYQLTPTVEPLTKLEEHATCYNPLSEESELHCLDVFRKSLLCSGPQPETSRNCFKRWWHANRVPYERTLRQIYCVTKLREAGIKFRNCFKGRPQANCGEVRRRPQQIHCVTELIEAGIKFRKRKTDRLLDIKFENGVLRIPGLFIHDGTKSLFLNLIAFEQCHLGCRNEITSYVSFMDSLINSPEDVGYLHYHGIIEHWLGSDADVAELFNRLCQEVVFDIIDSGLPRLFVDVNQHYNHRWNTWRANLRHNYFNNPWAIISFVAAGLLLLLTLLQTFYGVYGYYRPGS